MSESEPVEIGASFNKVVRGCLIVVKITTSVVMLFGIGCCAVLNSYQLSVNFPKGLSYDRVLASHEQSGLREGCVYIAYQLSEESVDVISRRGTAAMRDVRLARASKNPYSSYEATPLAVDRDHRALIDGKAEFLDALAADGGCDKREADIPNAHELLSEPGNFYSISQNREGVSIVSPKRRLVLFLYFG